MIPAILEFMRRAKAELAIPTGRVLEVGSYDVNGSPRSIFQGESDGYIGIDMMSGPGVDMVGNAESIGQHFQLASFDTAICTESLEHIVRPWLVVEAMRAVLKPGGHLWVSTPTFGFPLHRHPLDCYRFGEDAYRHWLYAGMDLLRLETVTDDLDQPVIVAVGRKR